MTSKFPPRLRFFVSANNTSADIDPGDKTDRIEAYISISEHEAIVAGLEKKLAEARYETIKWCAGRILISGKQVAQLFNCNDDIFIELAAAFSEVADEEKKAALAKLKGEA